MSEFEFIIKRGLTDNASRQLKITDEFLTFENKDIVNEAFTTFNKSEIVEYRYGVKWISLEVTFGREYLIFLKTKDNKTLKINFKTYFGRKKSEYNQKFYKILESLWKCYFENIALEYIAKHNAGEEFYIGDFLFAKDCVKFSSNGIINKNIVEIPWEKIRTSNYQTYFMIYSKDDPSKINRSYNYLDDWNTDVLYSVLRTLLNEKKLN